MGTRRPSSSHLSPFDLSGVGIGFGLYRPRRPSYTFATQTQRQRSESYRYAVRKSGSENEESDADFIEGIIQKKTRKESYIRATREEDEMEVELHDVKEAMRRIEDDMDGDSEAPTLPSSPIILINDKGLDDISEASNTGNHNNTKGQGVSRNGRSPYTRSAPAPQNHIQELKHVVEKNRYSPKLDKRSDNHEPQPADKIHMDLPYKTMDDEYTDDSVFASDVQQNGNDGNEAMTPASVENPTFSTPIRRITLKKNLILLCVSFLLLFNAFRAIQNLQSSLNNGQNLGIIAMTFVHGTMCLTCLWAPVLINNFTAKWSLVIGMLSFILWILGNYHPRFYTLIPLGMLAGVGKGILWTAESSYILKLSYDYSRVTREGLEKEMFRFHGIFLACFQTTHILGNLISSLVLQLTKNSQVKEPDPVVYSYMGEEYDTDYSMEGGIEFSSCGVLFSCLPNSTSGMNTVVLLICFPILFFLYSNHINIKTTL